MADMRGTPSPNKLIIILAYGGRFKQVERMHQAVRAPDAPSRKWRMSWDCTILR